jgi:hypothetical protein
VQSSVQSCLKVVEEDNCFSMQLSSSLGCCIVLDLGDFIDEKNNYLYVSMVESSQC